MQKIDERTSLQSKICRVTPKNFNEIALEVFRFQAKYNPIYQQFLKILNISIEAVDDINKIPFLPIQLFKSETIKTNHWKTQTIFTSSGTTGQIRSQHHIRSTNWYDEITILGFEKFYGRVEDYCILALLPSYLERQGSSLVHMADYFIKKSKYPESGFFLNDLEHLKNTLEQLIQRKVPVLLLGVSFALLDFAEQFPMPLKHTIIMETGGMKGRRKEMTRPELHQILSEAFQVEQIHSEYGMTELLSQSYSTGNGIFKTSPTKQILIKELTDPFSTQKSGKSGIINVIDLANLDSCAFIETQDIGRCFKDETFEILGRLDASDIRGCNLMVL